MNFSVYQKIWSILTLQQRRNAIGLFMLMLLGMLLETVGIGVVIPATALMTQKDLGVKYPQVASILEQLGSPDQPTLIMFGMLALVAIYALKVLFLSMLALWETRFAFKLQESLSRRLFENYLRQDYTFHLKHNSAELIRNVTGEVNLLTFDVTLPSIQLLSEGMVLMGLFGLLMVVEPLGALFAGIALGLTALIFHTATKHRVLRWGEARQYHEGQRLLHLQQGLGGAKDVKLLGREEDFLEQFSLHSAKFASVGQRQKTLLQLPRLGTELLAVIGLAILVFTMLYQKMEVGAIIPVLGLFAASAFRLIPSVNRILGAVQVLRYGLPVVNRIHEEVRNTSQFSILKSSGEFTFAQQLEIKDVVFHYPDADVDTLKGVSLTIKRGEAIGFIGMSGSGKSTLIDVILGLLHPQEGKVEVDGKDIATNLRGWQNKMGYVPQSIFLTDDTIRRNIAFGLSNKEIDENSVWRALREAQLEDLIKSLPKGLETIVGERGIRLSGGQRQRIGIARALYHNPSMLVMDEATSALDTATETEVMESVFKLRGEKTVVIIAHRLSTITRCDRVYELSAGKVVRQESGAAITV